MDKERDLPAGRQGPKTDSGYSEKKLDLTVDKTKNQIAVKGGNIFDYKKKKEKVILDATSQ